MKNKHHDLSNPHAQAIFECVDSALREVAMLAKKRAEETVVPLVVRATTEYFEQARPYTSTNNAKSLCLNKKPIVRNRTLLKTKILQNKRRADSHGVNAL